MLFRSKEERLEKADIVFLSTLGLCEDMIEYVKSKLSPRTKFYIIGEKNFGENNGQVYSQRYKKDYLKMTINMEEGYEEKNNRLRDKYKDNYIDMISMVQQSDGKVLVFSEDGLFISQDCRHLTKAGALYYASLIDWNRFFER